MEAQDQIQRNFQIMAVFMHARASKAPYHRMRVNDPRDGGHAWCVIMAGGCVAVRVRQVDTSAIISRHANMLNICAFSRYFEIWCQMPTLVILPVGLRL